MLGSLSISLCHYLLFAPVPVRSTPSSPAARGFAPSKSTLVDASDNSDEDDHDFDEDDVSLQSETDQSETTSTSTLDNDVSDEDDPRELSVLSEPVEVLKGWFGAPGKIPF